MKKLTLILSALLLLVFSACGDDDNPTPDCGDYDNSTPASCASSCTDEEELIANGGFGDDVTIIQHCQYAYLSGIDQAYPTHSNWDELTNSPCGNFRIAYEDGDAYQRLAEITPDPLDDTNSVIHLIVTEPHINGQDIKKGRCQLNFYGSNCLQEYYQTTKVFLPSANMEHLKTYENEVGFLTIFEVWNNKNWGNNVSNPFRIKVSLYKEPGTGNDFFFKVQGEKMPVWGNDVVLWEEINFTYPVPLGEWFEMELYLLEGKGNEGRFYMAITDDNNNKTLLFDINNHTVHPNENDPDGFKHINPLKLYSGEHIINHMKDGGYPLEIYWDDLELFRNKVPETIY